MSESGRGIPSCARCGALLAPGALGGLCPRCLMALNFAAPTEIPTEEGESHRTDSAQVSQEAPPPAEVAAHFPQLEVLECLGRGGMGAVYKARQKTLDRLVALKILAKDRQQDAQFAERFTREAKALARLSHPNIIAVFDYGETAGLCYLVMEYVEGVNLRRLLQTRPVTPKEALAIVPEICAALQYAHDHGIVHRDIKPENIMLDKQGQVKIADFGLAKLLGVAPPQERLTRPRDVMGTPHYMAPEQVERPQEVDHRADIYSLGVVFYELLTHELPLGRFPPPSSKVQIDVRLDEVVLRALEKEPERRYQQASQVKNDVETIATTAPPSPPEAAPGSKDVLPQTQSLRPLRSMGTKSEWITAARWTARVLGTLMLAAFVVMLMIQGMQPLPMLGRREQLASAAWCLALLGFVLGWKFEGTAAVLIALGWAFFPIAQGLQPLPYLSPLPFYVVVAALYAACWWATHGRKTRTVAGATAAVLAVLALSFMLAPAFTVRARIPGRDLQAARNLIDLTPHYNAALGENWMDPRDPRDTLGELPTGVQRLAGTEFDIRGLIQVERECRKHPPGVNGIAVGQVCRKLHFLHAARNAALVEDGLEIGRYVVHLANGEQREIPLVLGRELVDWHVQPRSREAFVTAWAGENPKSHKMRKQIRLFKSTWENPLPNVEVKAVDFVANCVGPCPFLVALTAE